MISESMSTTLKAKKRAMSAVMGEMKAKAATGTVEKKLQPTKLSRYEVGERFGRHTDAVPCGAPPRPELDLYNDAARAARGPDCCPLCAAAACRPRCCACTHAPPLPRCSRVLPPRALAARAATGTSRCSCTSMT